MILALTIIVTYLAIGIAVTAWFDRTDGNSFDYTDTGDLLFTGLFCAIWPPIFLMMLLGQLVKLASSR